MAKVKQHMGVAVTGPTPSLGVPFAAQPIQSAPPSPARQRAFSSGLHAGSAAPTHAKVTRTATLTVSQEAAKPVNARTRSASVSTAPSRARTPTPTARTSARGEVTTAHGASSTRRQTKRQPAVLSSSRGARTQTRDDVSTRQATTSAPVRQGARKPAASKQSAPNRVKSRAGAGAGARSKRSTTSTRATPRSKGATVVPASGARRSAAKAKAPKGAAREKGANKSRIQAAQLPAARVVRIKALDPFQKCGPRTSVVHLLRVDERQQGSSAVHLVFFDRHGWYCEHGPACRAVEDVRRQRKQLGLTI